MISRRNAEPLRFLPDESRSLPPPKLTDPRLLYIGFLGYCTGLVDNVIRRRPVVSADYMYAVRNREMFGYMKLHPEDFPEKEKKTYAEIFEKFHPIR
ncbi:PREDICTED: NADH dehydrogenase [ubiquinone] 1 subunit C2 isoform X3 [Colobus angolensis palliatus]|uniref:NADH dehydrogenase [ubiquinone] 1 subunit C2 n=1 Tax=Colobus angolensis palliatus TaxID=336983 RepID=A0A2K5JFK2_COLAP|nr:PREDICTED: NADH dehydrogenase [ubiquinone] 1 subunit C2 isoform X3 [Colobus angolensis palliatus]